MNHDAHALDEGFWSVTLSGALGDASGENLAKLATTLADAVDVAFDCAQIARINSIGAGKWIDFLRALPPKLVYRFETCPPVFVGYVNAVRPFRAKGTLASFQVPWHCAHCDRSFLVLARATDARAAIESATCKLCVRPATCETDLDYYLGFLG